MQTYRCALKIASVITLHLSLIDQHHYLRLSVIDHRNNPLPALALSWQNKLKMRRLRFAIILLTTLGSHVNGDCGCNKLDREAAPAQAQQQAPEQQVCQQQARNKNKHYRDYYAELELEPEIEGMSLIPGGSLHIGTNEPHFQQDHESPERLVKVKDFYLDKYQVSNANFEKFVKATNYTTEAESFGDSFLFKTLLTPSQQAELEDYRVVNALWWYKVKGVNWRKPHGVDSDLQGKQMKNSRKIDLIPLFARSGATSGGACVVARCCCLLQVGRQTFAQRS